MKKQTKQQIAYDKEIGDFGIPRGQEDRIRSLIKGEEMVDKANKSYKFHWPTQYTKDKANACLALRALILAGWEIESFIPDGQYFILNRMDLNLLGKK